MSYKGILRKLAPPDIYSQSDRSIKWDSWTVPIMLGTTLFFHLLAGTSLSSLLFGWFLNLAIYYGLAWILHYVIGWVHNRAEKKWAKQNAEHKQYLEDHGFYINDDLKAILDGPLYPEPYKVSRKKQEPPTEEKQWTEDDL